MPTSNQHFATAQPTRLFFRIAIPGMISMLAMSIYSFIEGIFIGHMIGEAAFAAVNVAMPFVFINFSLADLVGVGSSVPISIALGRGDRKRADNFFTCSLFLILLASLLMGSILFFASPAFVRWMGAEGELATFSVQYIRVYAIFGPVTTVLFAMDNYLRISGFARGSMLLNIGISGLTAVFLFLFLGPLLRMSIAGSALATCTAMTICAIISFVPFWRKKTVLRFVRPRLTLAMLREIVACGTPVFLNNIAGRIAAIVLNTALLRVGGPDLGQTAVAAYSVLMYASDIVQPMLYGLTDAVQPAVGYNWGARQLGRVKALTKCAFLSCAVVSLIGTAVMFFFPEAIASLFVKAEEIALLELSVRAMRLFCLAYLFRWFAFAAQGFYSAIEKPLPASVLSLCSAMIFPICFIFALSPLGLDGLWLNMAATSLCVAILAYIMLRSFQRKIGREMAPLD